MSDITSQSLSSLVKNIKEKKLSSEEVTTAFVNRSEKSKELNSYITEDFSNAIDKAKKFDEKPNLDLKLPGIPMAVKDLFCTKDIRTTAGSKILENFIPTYESTVTQNIWNEGAILLGKLNCDEFAMGSSNETSFYGNVQNPIDKGLVPGGSSGGSAAAVSGQLTPITIGTDTGGSIRQPASFTGTVGLKPTYGRISRHGLIAYASSFDQIGPFTNEVEDSALLLEVMAGADDYDSTASSKAVDGYTSFTEEKNLKIAVIKESYEMEGIDPEVKARMKELTDGLILDGHEVEYVSFPYLDYMVPTYYVLTTAEASSNLSRFDGVHYGYRNTEAKGVEETYKKSRSQGFGPEVKRRIMAGTFILSHGYYDAYYTKGQKVRRVLQDKTDEILSKFDFIMLPTTPTTAFEVDSVSDPITMYLQDIFTVHANLTGNPAVSIPIGQHSNGMPFGMQVIGNHFEEKRMLNFSRQLEKKGVEA